MSGWYILRQYEPNENGESYDDRAEYWTELPPPNTVLEVYFGPYQEQPERGRSTMMHRIYAEEQPQNDDPYPKYSWMESSMSCQNCGLDSCNGIDCYDKPEEYYYEGEDVARLDDLPCVMPATIEDEDLKF